MHWCRIYDCVAGVSTIQRDRGNLHHIKVLTASVTVAARNRSARRDWYLADLIALCRYPAR